MTTTLPYGTWPSPLSAADLFAGVASPANLQVDGDDLWWTETRPSQSGRQALVRGRGGAATDVGPEDWNCRTRVHEYGGAPFAVRDGVVVGAHFGDQRWYRLDTDEPAQVTSGSDASLRLADARFVPGSDWIVAVQERHGEGEPENVVTACALDGGECRTLVGGRDFVAAPRPSPDGTLLAWLAWDHPCMPWDAAELWVGRLDDGSLTDARHVAGGVAHAVSSPVWLDDERLAFAWEREEVSSLWIASGLHGSGVALDPTDGAPGGDIGVAGWLLGGQTIAPVGDGRVALAVNDRAVDHLRLLDLGTGEVEDLGVRAVRIADLRSWRDGVAWLGTEPDGSRSVATWRPSTGVVDVRRFEVEGMRPGDLPTVEAVEVPTPDGATTHAFVHHPACEGVVGPEDERPPLVVFIHGGPTASTSPVTGRLIAYWTTRGFAVADVNYRGSLGYGATYRDALLGRWGELDVVDTCAVAAALAERGVVDGERMAIRGGSAGGFTTLAALTATEHPFACGTSFFGVADLRLLAAHTHKFESRYLDRLVGPLPDAESVYVERSPLTHADRLATPVLVLQGLEDEVVPPEQSEQIVAAAAANGVPHAYIAFEGEQHGFRRLENLVAWHEAELSFYGQVMGFTPAGDIPHLELS